MSQDIRLKYTAQYPYYKVINEEVINKSLQILEEKKQANKNAMTLKGTFSKKATSTLSKTKKLEPFSKKIIQQD